MTITPRGQARLIKEHARLRDGGYVVLGYIGAVDRVGNDGRYRDLHDAKVPLVTHGKGPHRVLYAPPWFFCLWQNAVGRAKTRRSLRADLRLALRHAKAIESAWRLGSDAAVLAYLKSLRKRTKSRLGARPHPNP